MSLHKNPSAKDPLRLLGMPFASGIALLYLMVGELWIFLSDRLIKHLGKITDEHWCILSTSRGLIFIFSSGALLFLALNHFVSRARKIGQLRENENRYEIAASAANIGVWDRDIVNNRLIWDKQMAQIYGVQPEEFAGAYEAWKQCIHPEDRARAEQDVKQAERGEKDFDTEFRIVRPDGEVRHVRAFGKVLYDKVGRPVRMTGANYDITTGRQIEETLRARNEDLERFNRAATERELRMIELKNEINQLRRQLGQTVPYVVADMAQGISIPNSGLKSFWKKMFGKNKPYAA